MYFLRFENGFITTVVNFFRKSLLLLATSQSQTFLHLHSFTSNFILIFLVKVYFSTKHRNYILREDDELTFLDGNPRKLRHLLKLKGILGGKKKILLLNEKWNWFKLWNQGC